MAYATTATAVGPGTGPFAVGSSPTAMTGTTTTAGGGGGGSTNGGTTTATTAGAGTTSTSTSTSAPMPPELEQTLALMTSHRSVLGYLLITRGSPYAPHSSSSLHPSHSSAHPQPTTSGASTQNQNQHQNHNQNHNQHQPTHTHHHHPRMIRHSGIIFEGEQGRRYAAVVSRIVEVVQAGLWEVQGEDGVGSGVGVGVGSAGGGQAQGGMGQGQGGIGQGQGAAGRGDEVDVDEVRFMRIRTKRHEIMISPDDRYILAVLHDPGS